MGIAYVTAERIIFGEPVLVMVLVPVLGMSLGTTQGSELGYRWVSDGKSEGSCVGEIMLVNYFCVCFGGSGDRYTLVE